MKSARLKIILTKKLKKESEKISEKLNSKKLSKNAATFAYIDKTLIVLSETNGGVPIISFTTVIGAPVGIASVSFTLIF